MDMVGEPDFPRTLQFTSYTCGPCSVYSIATFFGVDVSYDEVKTGVRTDTEGTDERDVVRFLRRQGLRVSAREGLRFVQLVRALRDECVVLVGLDGDHYGVVHAYDDEDKIVYLADPSIRRQLGRCLTRERFEERWMNDGVIVRHRR